MLLTVAGLGSLALSIASAALAAPAPQAAELHEASMNELRRAIEPQRDGSHLSRILALRQQRDPALAPLFQSIATAEDWQLQVHGVLGLAEISPDHRIDAALVLAVSEPAQEAIIANAIDLDLLPVEEMEALSVHPGLPPMARAMLLAELHLQGRTIDDSVLAVSAQKADELSQASAIAALLLCERGDGSALSAARGALATLAPQPRERYALWCLEVIRQYKLAGSIAWVEELAAGDNREVAYWAIYTLLILDPARGVAKVEAVLTGAPAHRDRVRYGMLLLAAGPAIPAGAYDLIGTGDDALLRAMVEVGRARAEGRDCSTAMIALLDIGHLRSANWVMETLPTMEPEQAAAVYAHAIDLMSETSAPPGGSADRAARATEAAARLVEIDPAAVLVRLAEAEDDGLLQELLLLSLTGARAPEVGEAAAKIRRIGLGRADALALLIVARHRQVLEADDIRQLGLLAEGGGRISSGLQALAAWLYLRHSGKSDEALAAILGPNDAP